MRIRRGNRACCSSTTRSTSEAGVVADAAAFPRRRTAHRGRRHAGLALYGQLQPQVLIVDILLPGIDGATLITSLRSHAQFAHSHLSS